MLDQQLTTKARDMTHRMATLVVYLMDNGGIQSTRDLAINTLADIDIRAVSLLDQKGGELVHAGPDLLPVGKGQSLPGALSFFTTRDTLRAITPVVRANGDSSETIGWLQIEFAYSETRIQKHRAMLLAMIVLALVIGIYLSLCMKLSRSLINPIQAITDAVDNIEPKDRDSRLAADPGSIYVALELAINKLLERLTYSREALQRSADLSTNELQETLETIEIQNVELDLARKEALEACKSKSEFLANMSHEIRTPLNGISGYTALLLETELKSQQREYLSTIEKSAQGLMTMLNDILDFSRIEAGKLELDNQQLSIREVIDDVLAIMAPAAQQKSLELVSFIYEDTPEEIIGDKQRLSQILTNLVSNAVKFTNYGSVAIRVMLEQVDDAGIHTLKFTVTDTGSGLTAEQHSLIFKAFSQADSSRTRQAGGTGLGLSISKSLVEQMQGEIGLDSDLGRGSTFWFTLRTQPVKDENVLFKPQPIPGCHHLLLYEPQELSRLAIGHQIQSLGLKVTSFHSLVELQAYVETHHNHDLLLLSQGDDSLKRTLSIAENYRQQSPRQQSPRQQSPVLILTMAGSSNHPETLPTGIHCLLKPVARSKLLLAIQGMTSKTLLETDVMQPTKAVFEKQLNILIVDDNPVNLKLLETILLTMDQSVTTANNGFEAIECCHHKRFDLILMDVQMPDIDGLETTRRIRKINNIYQRIPIIAVTAHALLEERKQILQSGMDDYTTKPVNTRQLVSTISHWTGNPVQAPDEPTEEQVPGQLKTNASPIDKERSIQLAAGNQQLAREMLDMLLAGLPDDLQTIEESFQNSLHEPLLERVHRLHGACRYCAAPKLLDACLTLETSLKQTVQLNSPDIVQGVEAVIKAIKELLEWQRSKEAEAIA
ncbi:response regulator [Endozoicomonas sp. 4G]|uniref:response regulator n=1 Tax=Endozoicomonas sp. 4G TaxID=2872754 RepID=UPI002112275B|nr:response regulator [Endozoicomonas sp. 4G]